MRRTATWGVGLFVCGWWFAGPLAAAQAELTLKMLIVNPSQTEVKEFAIRSPLPPEVKPEHVVESDGLKVEYDSQTGTYDVVGSVTLKPRESVTKTIVLEDVWTVPTERVESFRREIDGITKKLAGSTYEDQGRVLAAAIKRNLLHIESGQEQPSLNPQQHISQYRENMKTLQLVESDLVSLRQLMVMAALAPSVNAPVLSGPDVGGMAHERGNLSVLTTWRLIFAILGLLGLVSLSFFLVWQRQLKQQLAKQAQETREQTIHPATPASPGMRPAAPQPASR